MFIMFAHPKIVVGVENQSSPARPGVEGGYGVGPEGSGNSEILHTHLSPPCWLHGAGLVPLLHCHLCHPHGGLPPSTI